MGAARMVMVIDLKKCVGCHTCAVACKAGNNLPNGVWWNRILTVGGAAMETPAGEYPNLTMQFMPLSCQHCGNPACVKACPVGATQQREDGVITQDQEKCIGCRYCMVACPYTGVRQFNAAPPQYHTDFRSGDQEAPEHQKGTVSKCIFCFTRLDEGETPNCMVLCPGRARYYGDLNDPNSEVSQLLRHRAHFQLLAEAGTKPSVYYLT
jgi:dimethyl sulfoxide reductase iron-sulfur subunit